MSRKTKLTREAVYAIVKQHNPKAELIETAPLGQNVLHIINACNERFGTRIRCEKPAGLLVLDLFQMLQI